MVLLLPNFQTTDERVHDLFTWKTNKKFYRVILQFVHQQLQEESLWFSITKSFFLDRVKDEGLMLETSAFQIFHGGNSTFINSLSLIKPKCLFHFSTDAVPQFL